METLIALLMDDYRKNRTIDLPGDLCRPDPNAVEILVEKLRILLFPGYFGGKYCKSNREGYITMLASEILWRLENLTELDCAREFLMGIPSIRAAMDLDLQAFVSGDPAAQGEEEIIVSYPGFYAIMVQRLAHSLHKLGVPLLPRMMTELAHSRTGIDIHPGAVLGASFFIDHGTGVVIGETTRIGNGVKLYQGVTLGAISTRGGQHLRQKKRHPTIEDAVTIYAGASILGGDTVIGKGAVIGANAFVTASVEPGAVVIGHRTDP
ncbi:MAG: serine acetyltransferase [Oscillospiraceae bacterium]|nr:serine acetyltransferase [Oscillospiraceae bacterium]